MIKKKTGLLSTFMKLDPTITLEFIEKEIESLPREAREKLRSCKLNINSPEFKEFLKNTLTEAEYRKCVCASLDEMNKNKPSRFRQEMKRDLVKFYRAIFPKSR